MLGNIELQKVKSFHPQLASWGYTTSCASEEGEVFIYGKTQPDMPPVIQKYSTDGELLNTWPAPGCGHWQQEGGQCHTIEHLIINSESYVVISCSTRQCRSITLYETRGDKVLTGYQDQGSGKPIPGPMCLNKVSCPADRLLAVNQRHRPNEQEVLVFDCTSTEFTITDRIPIDVIEPPHITCIETWSRGGLLIASDWRKNVISATSMRDKENVWKLEGELLRKTIDPQGICSDSSGRLFIADGKNQRILVSFGLLWPLDLSSVPKPES